MISSSSSDDKVIGFVGFGAMGNPIAANILKAGFCIRAFNRTPEKVLIWYNSLSDEFKAKVVIVNSPKECLSCPNGIVISMVSNDAALENVSKSILVDGGLGTGGIHLCLSTVSESKVLRQ